MIPALFRHLRRSSLRSRGARALVSALAAASAGASMSASAGAQSVLFDFNNAPNHTSLPIDLSVGGISAHFAATMQGFSIQDTSAPIVPAGFTGRFLYPNSVFPADLLVSFSKPLSAFSIWFAPQELACDDTATMRVSAYMDGAFVGSQTALAPQPGTYPVGTLSCSFAQGFNSVVVHYDKKPPTCSDYGPIFLADNMTVTPQPTPVWLDLGSGLAGVSGIPSLLGTGTLVAGTPGALTLSNARPSSPCMLVFATSSVPTPFMGGVLLASPPTLANVMATLPNGTLPLPFTWPSGIAPGSSMWVQYAIFDPAAVQSVALSNALKATTP